MVGCWLHVLDSYSFDGDATAPQADLDDCGASPFEPGTDHWFKLVLDHRPHGAGVGALLREIVEYGVIPVQNDAGMRQPLLNLLHRERRDLAQSGETQRRERHELVN